MRVLIGEDEALMREGLELVLERGGFSVVGAATDADQLLEMVRAHSPDLVVTDIRMPPTHTDEGLRGALEIRGSFPSIAIMVLSQHVQRRYAVELLAARPEGVGYLLKQRVAAIEDFLADLHRICAGESVLDPEVAAALMARPRREDDPIHRLTPRQCEVLTLMAEGRSNAAIGERLVVSDKAVVKHVSQIYDQLGLAPGPGDHRRVLAVVEYLSR